MNTYHTPVLITQVIHGLHIEPGKKYIDATLGGGGHGYEILKRGGHLLGLDTDIAAIEFAKKRFEAGNEAIPHSTKWKCVQGNFRDIEQISRKNGWDHVSGILFDLGVSSHQLDTPDRGFSYRFVGSPLDMRLDQSRGETAAHLVMRLSEGELYEIFAKFGEEERAGAIAHALVRARQIKKITSTDDIVSSVTEIVGNGKQAMPVLSRVFQSLRMSVNDEMESLKFGLRGAHALLAPGGRLAVISFHSLEDRVVKQFMHTAAMRLETKKPSTAQWEEIAANPRSRSAKLRIAQKI